MSAQSRDHPLLLPPAAAAVVAAATTGEPYTLQYVLAETANFGTGMTRSCYTVLGCAGFKVQGVGFRIDVEENVLSAIREHQQTNYMADSVWLGAQSLQKL